MWDKVTGGDGRQRLSSLCSAAMWRELGISRREWESAPPDVRFALLSLQHRLRLAEIRCAAYEKELAALRQQAARLDDLTAEIAELRERLGQTSRNSSRPPSSDPASAKATPPATPTGRKRGGQPGHPGHSRRLIPAEAVDHVVDLKPGRCRRCGRRLRGEDPQPQRHQVSEVPRVRAEVTEYRRHRLRCRGCGAATRPDWPAGMPPGRFGPRVQAITGYLTGRLGASHRDVAEALRVLYDLSVSTGSVSALQRHLSRALAAPVAAAQQFVHQQRAQYVDETAWPEGPHRRWLWVNATADVTVFSLLGGRSAEQAKQVISPSAKGVIVTDRHGAYNWLPARRRQLCWAHLRRDFQALVDRGGESAEVGAALLEQSKQLFAHGRAVRDGELSHQRLETTLRPIRQKVKALLEAGTRVGHSKTRRTCANILKVERALWTFARVEGVEPTNNAAERGLRRAVVWRRTSFGTQSAAGSRFVGRVLTAVATLRQQRRDILEYLTWVCAWTGQDTGTAVCLLPQPP